VGNELETRYQQTLSALKTYEQQHVLGFWDELSRDQQQQLLDQLEEIDLSLMKELFEGEHQDTDWGAIAAAATAPPGIRLNEMTADRVAEARRLGEQALRAGRVGIVLVAGGQGSRLGFPHPKGMFSIGPVSGRTLFQVHVDRLLAMSQRYGVDIPFYLMTSPATHDETIAYFHEHDRLGLKPEDLIVFRQGTMPAVDAQSGKLLLEAKDSLFLSPDGHGGMLAALARSGALADMERRGVDLLFYFQVDNPLVALADPVFIGFHLAADSELTSQVVGKRQPKDKVGNVILADGRVRVIEYSDLPDEAAERRNADGSLAIWAGSIAVHVMDVPFLRRALDQVDSLPFHRAHKAVPYVDDSGEKVEPSKPNAIKFERFIFDLLPHARNAIVVEVDEREAFAPLKNASGVASDTKETAQAAMVAQHRRWIEHAGGQVAPGTLVEISPHFAVDEAEFAAKWTAPRTISANEFIQ
jgi:UDP-N-acetylglucosamine/UDP-N-acetylgalactosamine diphosphorylase